MLHMLGSTQKYATRDFQGKQIVHLNIARLGYESGRSQKKSRLRRALIFIYRFQLTAIFIRKFIKRHF
jgi:hypothetical protein